MGSTFLDLIDLILDLKRACASIPGLFPCGGAIARLEGTMTPVPVPVSRATSDSAHSRALMRVIHGITAGSAERATNDLTVRERLVVQRLGLEGDTPIAALGQALGIRASSMTSVVDRLEQKGHLRRVAHATDRRATLLTLTRKGRAVFARELDFYRALIEETLAPLGDRAMSHVLGALRMLETSLALADEDEDAA